MQVLAGRSRDCISHDDIIRAFTKHVPGSYVRDYRDSGGYITICRGYQDIRWGGQLSTTYVERSIPHITLCSLPKGNVTRATLYSGVRLSRPGWQEQFRKARRHLSRDQQKRIAAELRRDLSIFGPGVM